MNSQLAFDILEELGIPPVTTGLEMAQCAVPDRLTMMSYLTQVYDLFRGEIPYVKHSKQVRRLVPSTFLFGFPFLTLSDRKRNESHHKPVLFFEDFCFLIFTDNHLGSLNILEGLGF